MQYVFNSDILIVSEVKEARTTQSKLTKGGRKDEQQTIRVAQILHLAATNQNTWRACKVESTTQRTHKRRNAGSNDESMQRQRVGNASRARVKHQHGGADRHNKAKKNKSKRNLKK